MEKSGIQLLVKREDLIHPHLSGNKWRKLKYNIQEAKSEVHTCLLTFGGAYSNHIAALAVAGKESGFHTIGLIRGEETLPLNPTLSFAKSNGMQLEYLDRETYRNKEDSDLFEKLKKRFGEFYLVPEGGSNELGVQGCEEILNDVTMDYDVVVCACGTGATLAGMVRSLPAGKKAIGISAYAASSRNGSSQTSKFASLSWIISSPNPPPATSTTVVAAQTAKP